MLEAELFKQRLYHSTLFMTICYPESLSPLKSELDIFPFANWRYPQKVWKKVKGGVGSLVNFLKEPGREAQMKGVHRHEQRGYYE